MSNYNNKIFNSFGWAFFDSISQQLMSFVVATILARLIFPSEFGIIALVNAFFSICESLIVNGFATSLIQKKNPNEDDYNTVFVFNLIISILISIIILIILPIIMKNRDNYQYAKVLKYMIIQIPISSFVSVETTFLYKRMLFKKTFFATLISSAVSGFFGILFAYFGYGIWALVIQKNLMYIINSLLLIYVSKWVPKFKFNFSSLKELSGFGIKSAATSLLGTVFNHLKTFVIGIRYTASDLAFFSKGESFPLLLSNNIDATVNKVLFPVLSNVQDDRKEHIKYLKTMIRIESYIIFPIMVGLFVVGDNLIEILLTNKWLYCVQYLKIVCIQQCFSFITTINLQAYKSLGRADISLKLEAIKKPFFILIIIITSRISVNAIAYGLLLYEIVALIINSYPAKNVLKYSILEQLKDLFPNLIIALLMGISVYLLGKIIKVSILALLIQILFGVFSYLLLSAIFKNSTYNFLKDYLKQII